MATMKTPGVYIVEKNAFPNSVVEVATAVPAFVGWTERAGHGSKSLHNTPFRVTSLAEFNQYFGGPPTSDHVRFVLARSTGTTSRARADVALSSRDAAPFHAVFDDYTLTQVSGKYFLYYALCLFFMNGGGACYIVSAGQYGESVSAAPLNSAIESLVQELEPTLLVVPDAVLLPQQACYAVQTEMLAHCGRTMKNRFAILDIWEGYLPRNDLPDVVTAFRDGIGANHRSYGAAYYPWLNAVIVQPQHLGLVNLADDASREILITDLKAEVAASGVDLTRRATLEGEIKKIRSALDPIAVKQLEALLNTASTLYRTIIDQMAKRLNMLPPSAAMAGIFTIVDSERGVWNAPANVGVDGVEGLAVAISDEAQTDLNVTPQGVSINAIRTLIARGALVWGARTLDGSSSDWRYINVRRTMIMLEESIRLALKSFSFEPNEQATWVTAKSMISNFLTGIWQRGGLAGASATDAFSVRLGLGETMTPADIEEGLLRTTVLVAITRPAEFIEITLEQRLQKR